MISALPPKADIPPGTRHVCFVPEADIGTSIRRVVSKVGRGRLMMRGLEILGLGLSISHDIIVKQHAGTIEVDTRPDEFTEIRIVLPRAPQLI